MSTASKTLAKSLHTVSVIVATARLIQRTDTSASPEWLVSQALAALGYADAVDPYGLADKALAAMRPAVPRVATRAADVYAVNAPLGARTGY